MPASMSPPDHLIIAVADKPEGPARTARTTSELIAVTQKVLGRAHSATSREDADFFVRAADVYARLAHAAAIAETGGAR